MNDFLKKAVRWVRRTVVAVIGIVIVQAGIFMIFLPGPGMLIIPAGLAVLATEFVWAKTLLAKLRDAVGRVVKKYRKGAAEPGDDEEQ